MGVCDRFDDLGLDDPDESYRLGIFGGTFDPVHTGHLAAAERVRQDARLDAVVFMPAGVPVFKLDQKVTTGEERLQMCRTTVAIVDIISMLPDVHRQQRFEAFSDRIAGIGFLGDDEFAILIRGEPNPP